MQLDEVFAPLAHLLESDSNLVEFNSGSSWLWTAIDPVTKLFLVVGVGERSLAVAQAVVHQVKQRLAVDCLSVFFTDGLAHYKTALLDPLWVLGTALLISDCRSFYQTTLVPLA